MLLALLAAGGAALSHTVRAAPVAELLSFSSWPSSVVFQKATLPFSPRHRVKAIPAQMLKMHKHRVCRQKPEGNCFIYASFSGLSHQFLS